MKRQTYVYLGLGVGALVVSYPFAWMFTTALKTIQEANTPALFKPPEQWMWGNFLEAFEAAPFTVYFFNSFIVAFVVTGSVVVTSIMAGYAFAQLKFRWSARLFSIVLATMMIPFEITLIPNFVLISSLGWYNSYAALIVPWCANAFSIFLMRQAFLALPRDYFEAARIDGCGHLRYLVSIAAPLVKPMIVTVGLFAFLGSYNSLIWPLVVTGDDSMRVVQVGLTVFSGAEGVRLHLLMCASLIVIMPTVALYFVAQRYFLEGAVTAGIKT